MSNKMVAGLVGIILGFVLVFIGLGTTVSDNDLPEIPSRILPSFVTRSSREAITGEGTPEYVGGDAYNFIIESAIRGGEISGAITSRAIYSKAATIARSVYISAGMLSIAIGAMVFLSGMDRKKADSVVAVKEKEDLAVVVNEEDSDAAVSEEDPIVATIESPSDE